MIERLMTQVLTLERDVPTDEKNSLGHPVIAVASASVKGYVQIESQFADPAQGLDGNTVRVYLPASANVEYLARIVAGRWTYEPRGKVHEQFNLRTQTVQYQLLRARVAS